MDRTLELIYLQAGCAARRAEMRGRTRAELQKVDHSRLADELRVRRLLPAIGGRLLDAGEGLCPPSFAAQVSEARTAARAQGLGILAVTKRVTARLAEEGVPALPLKGPILAEEAHGDLGLRETADVDLLVAPDRLHHAARSLLRDGFRAPADRLMANGLPSLHLALPHATRPTVELHWRAHWHEDDLSRQVLARARAGDDGLLRAAPEDLCAGLLLFYARDGFQGMRLAVDIAAWWDRHGHTLAPGFLDEYTHRNPDLTAALTAATAVLEDTTGTPSRAWLRTPRGGRGAALGARLADWAQEGDRDQLAANISLVGGLLGPARRLPDFVRRELVSPEGPPTPHAGKMLMRYALALWRVRGGRRWTEYPALVPRRVELCGVPIDVVTEGEVVAHVIGALEQKVGGWVITTNLDQVRQYSQKSDVRALFETADLVVADGMPLVWASRLAGSALPERVAGSDLIWSLSREAARGRHSVFFLGGAPGAAEGAVERLQGIHPELQVAGLYSPPFGFDSDPAEHEQIRSLLQESKPDIVFVALGFPRQERLIAQLRTILRGTWFLGVGISFSFVAGDVRRAPELLQRIGLEWLHRLVMEPRRLARRYLWHGLPFATRLVVHAIVARLRGGLPPGTHPRD